jgi:hypothetical protein
MVLRGGGAALTVHGTAYGLEMAVNAKIPPGGGRGAQLTPAALWEEVMDTSIRLCRFQSQQQRQVRRSLALAPSHRSMSQPPVSIHLHSEGEATLQVETRAHHYLSTSVQICLGRCGCILPQG